MFRTIAVGAIVTATLTVATPVNAATADVIVGNNTGGKYWFTQTSGDCEEAAFDTIYGDVHGYRLHEASVEVAAEKLGVLAIPSANGSNWFGPDGIARLGAHYGIKLTVGAHKIATIEKDLKSGDLVIAQVNAETIWAAIPPADFATPPAGEAWDFTDTTAPDHAVVVDSIDETARTVTLTDSGQAKGALETVPITAFNQSMSTSGYQYAVTSKDGK